MLAVLWTPVRVALATAALTAIPALSMQRVITTASINELIDHSDSVGQCALFRGRRIGCRTWGRGGCGVVLPHRIRWDGVCDDCSPPGRRTASGAQWPFQLRMWAFTFIDWLSELGLTWALLIHTVVFFYSRGPWIMSLNPCLAMHMQFQCSRLCPCGSSFLSR